LTNVKAETVASVSEMQLAVPPVDALAASTASEGKVRQLNEN
jgi:hypothetical protein